jgi:uncharacterized repeat protein (TIGR01451 family)
MVVSGAVLAAPAQAVNGDPITMTKEVIDGPLVAGSATPVSFKITVTNNSGEEALLDLLDVLPPGLVLAGVSSDKWVNCSTQSPAVLCQPVTFNPDETASLVVTATAPSWMRAGTLTNCADTIWSVNNQPVRLVGGCLEQVTAVARADVQVVEDADLELTASHATQYDQVDPGKDAVVDFAVKNNGPSDASGPIRVKGSLPTGLTFVAGSAPWTCSAVGQDVSCEWTPPAPPPVDAAVSRSVSERVLSARGTVTAQSADVSVAVPAESLLPVGESAPPLSWTVTTAKPGVVPSYPVSATASSASADSKPANNTATTPIGVTPVDVAIVKSATGSFTVDQQGVWKLTVSNVGTIDDAGVLTLVDTLPEGSTLASASGAGWDCKAAGFTVTCTHAGLTKGAVSELTLTTDVKSGVPEVTNNATVTSTSYEKETGNNTTSAKAKVRRAAQTAAPLPSSPTRVKAGKTDQGQKLRTRVLCRPVKATAAGEVSFCKVKRSAGVVRIKVVGSRPMKVTVIQTAKGTDDYKPFVQRKTYIVRP